jgi:hypothetical protein
MSKLIKGVIASEFATKRVATYVPASPEGVAIVMAASPDDPEGRSEWLWVRLSNGDLMLATFPQSTPISQSKRLY